MASPPGSTSALLLSSVLLLLTLRAAARPCKTLFVSNAVSSTTYGVASSGSATAFDGSLVATAGEQVPSIFFTIYRISPAHYHSYVSYSSSSAAASSAEPVVTGLRLPIGNEHPIRGELPFGGSSARERARDILIVVAGLLFGVGCGGLASVAMYLACSLINDRYEVRGSHGDDGVESSKRMGYTHLPTVLATPVATLKEGHAGN